MTQVNDSATLHEADRYEDRQTVNTLQPRFVLANRQPSVVAIGTVYFTPSNCSGPTTPTGMGM